MTIEELVALQAIRDLKAKYFYYTDTQQWDALLALFLANAITDFREAVQPHNPDLLLHDPASFVANNAFVLAGVTTMHLGFNPQIEFQGPDAATGIWAMEDWLWIPAGTNVLPHGTVHGFGHYHDSYRRVDGQWRIAATRLTRVHIE